MLSARNLPFSICCVPEYVHAHVCACAHALFFFWGGRGREITFWKRLNIPIFNWETWPCIVNENHAREQLANQLAEKMTIQMSFIGNHFASGIILLSMVNALSFLWLLSAWMKLCSAKMAMLIFLLCWLGDVGRCWTVLANFKLSAVSNCNARSCLFLQVFVSRQNGESYSSVLCPQNLEMLKYAHLTLKLIYKHIGFWTENVTFSLDVKFVAAIESLYHFGLKAGELLHQGLKVGIGTWKGVVLHIMPSIRGLGQYAMVI